MAPILQIDKLSKQYNNQTGVKNISLNISKGETVAIVGPSGSGKSTLLRCIAGIEKPEKGSIHFQGTDIHTIRGYRGIGMVFQSFNIFPHMTVLENVSIGLEIVKKYSKEQSRSMAMEYLKQLRLSDKINEYPEFLSGGQKQRVGIARAVAMEPQLLLFDEPTSALDPKLSSEVFRAIFDIKSKDMTLIIVTHDMNFCKQISERVIVLEEGSIVEDARTKDFFQTNPFKEEELSYESK